VRGASSPEFEGFVDAGATILKKITGLDRRRKKAVIIRAPEPKPDEE
jgi:hypothetical protein